MQMTRFLFIYFEHRVELQLVPPRVQSPLKDLKINSLALIMYG